MTPTGHYNPRDIAEFNPADLENLVRFCVQELMARPTYRLPLPSPFVGAGIYALFYDGDFGLYQYDLVRSPDATHPIYVGRARLTKSSGSRPLYGRLGRHATSISEAENLRIEDFRCRFLVLHPLWVSTVENLLIRHFHPLWNDAITGFGLHDPGGKRHTGNVSLWDVLHPGRPHQRMMAERGAMTRSYEDVASIVRQYREQYQAPPPNVSPTEVEAALQSELSDDEP